MRYLNQIIVICIDVGIIGQRTIQQTWSSLKPLERYERAMSILVQLVNFSMQAIHVSSPQLKTTFQMFSY